MTAELSQFIGDLKVTRYVDKRHMAFTVHRGDALLVRCRGFTTSEYRERAVHSQVRRLQGLPPIITTSKEVGEETRAILRVWAERFYPQELAEAA